MPGEALQIRIVASGASQVQAESAKSSAALSGIGKAAKGASAESAAASSSLTSRLKKVGPAATAVGKQTAKGLKYGAVAAVGLGVAAAKMSIDFTHSMGQISEQAGATKSEVEKLKGEVLDLAKKSIFSPNDLAQGLFHIESVGIRGAKAMKTLNAAQKLATVGNADLETTTYAMVSAQETGIKGTKNLTKEIGLLNAIVGTGDLRMEDLTAALSSGILPTAKSFGLSLRDVGAALDVMTARGVPAQQAATRLRMTFSLLGAQTDKAKGALSSIGIEEGKLGEVLQKKGLIPAVQLLADKLKNAGDKAAQAQVLTEAFGGGKSSATIMTLVQNVDDLGQRYDTLGKNAGNFNEKLKEAKDEPINKLKTAWSNVQVLLINLGSKIVPSVVDGFTKVVDIVTDDKLTADEKFTKLGKLASDALGSILKKAGEVGPKVVGVLLKGIASAWTNSDALGKLFVAGALIRVIGGKGALLATGKAIGGYIGAGAATSMETEMATAGAAGGALGTSGKVATGLRSSALMMGKKVVGLALAYGTISGLTSTLSESNAKTDLQSRLSDFGVNAFRSFGINTGQTTAEQFSDAFKAKLSDLSFSSIGLGKQVLVPDKAAIQAQITKQLGGFSEATAPVIAQKTEEAYNKALAKMRTQKPSRATTQRLFGDIWDQMTPDDKTLARQVHKAAVDLNRLWSHTHINLPANLIKADPKTADKLFRSLDQNFQLLKSGNLKTFSDIQRVVDKNTTLIGDHLKKGTAAWRDAMAQNMRAGATAIGVAMHDSGHVTKAGLDRITELIHQANVLSPTKKMASDFGKTWADGLDHTKNVTSKGVGDIIDRLGKLPPKARQIATDTMLSQLRIAHQQGKLSDNAFQKIESSIISHFTGIKIGANKQTDQMKQGVGKTIDGLVAAVSHGMATLGKNTNQNLKALGVNPVKFVTTSDNQKVGIGRQRGGDIPGAGIGDKVPAMLEPGEFVVNRKAAAKHGALLHRMNFEDAPRFQKGGAVGMAAMIAEANKFESHHFPYSWGGGHGSFGIQPVDCSGAVSDVLHAAGLLSAPMVSGSLMNWGHPGKGPLTVYANPEHTFMSLNGRYFGTSGSNPGGGAGWVDGGYPSSYLSGFAARTMDVKGGVMQKIARQILHGPDGPLKSIGQAAMDKVWHGASAYVAKHTPSGSFGGGQGLSEVDLKGARTVTASWYGPTSGQGSNPIGAGQVPMKGNMFAELNRGTALGHLPYGAKIGLGVGGKSAILAKEDIGAGGPGLAGTVRAVDVWRDAAGPLGLISAGLALAKVKRLQKGGHVKGGGAGPGGPGSHGGGPFWAMLGGGKFAKKLRRHYLHKIKGEGLPNKLKKQIHALETEQARDDDYASRAQGLDVQHDDGTTAYGKVDDHTALEWLGGKPGFRGELQTLMDLRNQLLHGEDAIGGEQHKLSKQLRKAEHKLKSEEKASKNWGKKRADLKHQLHDLQKDRDKHGGPDATLKKLRDQRDHLEKQLEHTKDHKKREGIKHDIDKVERQLAAKGDTKAMSAQIAELHKKLKPVNKQVQKHDHEAGVLKDKIIPAIKKQMGTEGNKGDLKDLATSLQEIQGYPAAGYDDKPLNKIPAIGVLGGTFNEVQTSIAQILADRVQPPKPLPVWKKEMFGVAVWEKQIAALDERIDLATRKYAFPGSEWGGDLSDNERKDLIGLNKSLLGDLTGESGLVSRLLAQFKQALPDLDKATADWVKSKSPDLKQKLTDLEGVTGKGGRIFDVRETLAQLGEQTAAPSDAARADILAQLLEQEQRKLLVSQLQYGPFKDFFANLPAHHDGGVVTGAGTREVIRRMIPGEGVIDRDTMRRGLSGGNVVLNLELVVEDEAVDTSKIRFIARDEAGKEIKARISSSRRRHAPAPVAQR